MDDLLEATRLVEALLFASAEPVSEAEIAKRLPPGMKPAAVLERLQMDYAGRGVEPIRTAGHWHFRTAPDLAPALALSRHETRRLSRAMEETLAIIAYHQPITRPEIEAIRGVSIGSTTMDGLLETGWVKPGPRKSVPGRPLTWLTTPAFLEAFALASLDDLPGVEELKTAGLLNTEPNSRREARSEPPPPRAGETEE